jgi:hypothetical protein
VSSALLAYLRGVQITESHTDPFEPEQLATLAGYWDSRDLSDGAVASWVSRDSSQQAPAQATGSVQPTKGATGVVWDGNDDLARSPQAARFLSGATLPDGASASTAGKGWTGTGLARAPDGTFYVGNHGKAQSGDPTFAASVVHVSADFSTILDEILLVPLYPSIETVQGVAYDTSDNTLWIADTAGTKIRHLTLAGAAIVADEITPSFPPNGLAYDPTNDGLWIWEEQTSGNGLERRACADGSVQFAEVSVTLGNNDQLFYDDTNKVLFFSHGASGATGAVTFASTASAALITMGSIQLTAEADAIEGIVIVGNRLYVANDAWFHPGTPALNRILTFAIAPPVANVFDWFMVLTVPATTGTDAIATIGDPLANATVGVGLYSASATDLRLFAHTGGTGTTTQESVTGVSPSLTVPRIVYARADQANNAMTLWVDGTQIATDSAAALVGALSGGGTLHLGASSGGGRSPTMTLKAIGYSLLSAAQLAAEDPRQKLEGYLAHEFALTANLPGDHPYKTDAPEA